MPTGTPGSDAIAGTNFDELYLGLAGDDKLIASLGFDTLDGGAGSDVADYSAIGTVVTLGAKGELKKGIFTDKLISIETVIGSSLLGDTIDHSAAVTGGAARDTGTGQFQAGTRRRGRVAPASRSRSVAAARSK